LQSVQERAGNILEAIGIGKEFLNRTPAAQQLRESMDKWDYMKLKKDHSILISFFSYQNVLLCF
jgi:hypothetical protein